MVLERLKLKNCENGISGKQIVINKSISLPLLENYCEKNKIEILNIEDKGSNIIMHINYPQNSLKILDSHFDIVCLCVIIAQAYNQQKSFKDQVSELTGNKTLYFNTYPV